MLISESMQEEILNKIAMDSANIESEILQDIILEWAPRRDEMIGLYNRSILQASSQSYKQGGTANDGKFLRSIDYDGIPIYSLTLANQNNVNKPVHHDYLNTIKTNFQDYMTGTPAVIVYDSGNQEDDKTKTKDINGWAKKESLQSKFGKVSGDDCQSGTGYLMLYQDGENLHVKALESHEALVIYDTNGDPQLGLRIWDGSEKELADNKRLEEYEYTYIELYDHEKVRFYRAPGSVSANNVGTFQPWGRDMPGFEEEIVEIPHVMNGVPIIEFPKDATRVGDVEKSIDLQDLYDLLDTGLNNEILQQAMAYIVMKGLGKDIDAEFKQQLTDTGIFSIDADGEIYYLEKSLNDDALSRSMERVKKAIYENSSSIDYSELTGDTRIMGLEQKLKKIDASVTKTIRAWDIPLMNFWGIVFGYWNEFEGGSYEVEELEVIFVKNKPRDVFAEMVAFAQAGGRISNKTKIEQLSFVKNAEKEMERLTDEMETVELDPLDNIEA